MYYIDVKQEINKKKGSGLSSSMTYFLSDENSKTFPPTTFFWLTHLYHPIILIITTETAFLPFVLTTRSYIINIYSYKFLLPQLHLSYPYQQLLIAIFAA